MTFTTIYPGCYSGRWPHIHVEVYLSLTQATGYQNKIKISQIATPADSSGTVYGSATGYSASVSNLASISLATDNVFSDGATPETPSVSGNITDGYAIALTEGIAA